MNQYFGSLFKKHNKYQIQQQKKAENNTYQLSIRAGEKGHLIYEAGIPKASIKNVNKETRWNSFLGPVTSDLALHIFVLHVSERLHGT